MFEEVTLELDVTEATGVEGRRDVLSRTATATYSVYDPEFSRDKASAHS